MKRKRRKAYRKWRILNTTICTSQPAGQACQENIKDLEKEVKGDTLEAVFHQTGTLGKSKENGDEQTSASMNGKQNSSFLPKDKKQHPSDSKVRSGKENDDPPSTISHQPKKILPVVIFNDCEESLSGKITLQDFPSTAEASKPAKGKYTTEVKCGAFHVKVEIKKSFFCKTGMQFPTKTRCSNCHQRFSVRHNQRCYASGNYFPKYKNISVKEPKPEVPSKYQGEITRTDSPLLKVSIAGKEIKVKYTSKKQNILINITHPKRKEKITKYRDVSSNHTTKESSRSLSQSGARHPENRQLENKHQSSDCMHVSPPIVLPVQKEKNVDTVVVSLTATPEREKNNPDTLPSVLDDCEVGSAISQQKVLKMSQDAPQMNHFSEAETFLKTILSTSQNTLKTTSLSNTDLTKMPFENPKDIYKERKMNFDILENITSDSHIQQSTERINNLPSTITDIFPFQNGKDSNFCSLSSLNMQLVGEKAANVYCEGSQTSPAECCEDSNSLSFASSQNALQPCTSFSPSHWATRYSDPKEIPGDTVSFNHCTTVSFNHCTESVLDYEKEHVDVTDRDFNKAIVHSDSHANAQQLLERKSTECPTFRPAPCSSPAAGSPHDSISPSTVEWNQTESQASHSETAAPSKAKAPGMTFITDELEQRLITQNDKEVTADSNCPMGKRNPKELPRSLENVEKDKCQIIPLVANGSHRDFEDLSNENHDEVFFQMDFSLNTAESNWAVSATDNLFLTEKILSNDVDQYGCQDKKSFRLTGFKQEPEEYPRTTSTMVNSEGDESKNDSKENYYHQIEVFLSPQKQKTLKDWNLEINNLRKLSQELAPRGARASDGSQEEAIDQWARRRQQFRDGKRYSSAGESSFASNITEGSITSEDGRSVDFGFRVDIEEKGFYTENFHSAAWVFRGDDGNPEDSPRCLSKKPRPVAGKNSTIMCKRPCFGMQVTLESIFCILLVVEAFSLHKVVEMLEEVVSVGERSQVNMADKAKLHSPICSTFEALVVQHVVRCCRQEKPDPFS
nr:uncharacterized protein LOC105854777 [Microcebus murinus]